MDIESFVSQTLEQLGAGIEKVKGKPGINVSPAPITRYDNSNLAGDHIIDSRGNGAVVVFVQFDLSVVVRGHAEGGAKAGLEVLGFDSAARSLKAGLITPAFSALSSRCRSASLVLSRGALARRSPAGFH
jgi:hypothetical protein